MTRYLIIINILFSPFFNFESLAQSIEITGKVVDDSGEALRGVNVYFLNSFVGTATNANGEFILKANIRPPQVMIASMVGYKNFRDTIKSEGKFEKFIKLTESPIYGQEVIVSVSRIEENFLASPVTVEKLDAIEIANMSAANFYDGLGSVKGIDMNMQSLTLKLPNTRGFNNNTNYRFNQIIDGVNNVAPGLSFAAGNLFGSSQLDVESIELLPGASSALYGSGGMNGTLIINTKNPYDYQGLSTSFQAGLMNIGSVEYDHPTPYYDLNLRYAKAINRFAFKLTTSYLKADEWAASDYRNKRALDNPDSDRNSNPGYDGVNVYGDEFALNLKDIASTIADGYARNLGFEKGSSGYDSTYHLVLNIIPDQNVTRTGWKEVDLVDYDAKNLKTGLSLHYKVKPNLEAGLSGNYASGQAVYSAINRFSATNFSMWRLKSELKHDDYFIRYWYLKENSGKSYDAGAAGVLINEAWKPGSIWYQDFISGFLQSRLFGQSQENAFRFGRLLADNRDNRGNIQNPELPAIPLAGSPEFEQHFRSITQKTIGEGGASIKDFSSMGQIEGMYNFSNLLNGLNILAGFQYRHYRIDSDGTIFTDEPGNPILIYEWGTYAQYIGDFFNEKLKLNISGRYDKNENFKGRFTPRFSMVVNAGKKKDHFIRGSVQSAFRFPAISDQWLDTVTGNSRVVGGLASIQGKYGFFSNPTYPLVGANPITGIPDTTGGPFIIPEFRPETVLAFELGYKSIWFDDKFLIDASIYNNEYYGFHGAQLLVQDPFTENEQRYQTTISTNESVTSWGWSLGLDYQFPRGFSTGGNISYNGILSEKSAETGFQTRFNTPEYRFNLYLGNRHLNPRLGFKINYHWQQSFIWQASFGVGEIPAYSTLDAQISYRIPNIKSMIRIGGANLLNNYYVTSFGSSKIGGLYYVTFVYDQLFR
jgi:iron complex outermembrane recepter protein